MTSPKYIKNHRTRSIQNLRIAIREISHHAFHEALNKNDLNLYFKKLNNYIYELNSKYKVPLSIRIIKFLKNKLRNFFRKFQR